MSCRELLANTHLNLFDELRAQRDAGYHLQEQHNPFIASITTLLRYTQAILDLLEALHYTHTDTHIHHVGIYRNTPVV